MAQWAVAQRSATIGLACQAFGISQTCYRYRAKLDAENAVVADWLVQQPAQLGLRPVLPVFAQREGFQMESQACLQDLSRAGTEPADQDATSPDARKTAAAGRACTDQ